MRRKPTVKKPKPHHDISTTKPSTLVSSLSAALAPHLLPPHPDCGSETRRRCWLALCSPDHPPVAMVVRLWTRVAAAAIALCHAQRALLLTAAAGAAGTEQALALPTLDSAHVASGRLSVVVPVWSGDVDRALDSVSRWPTACSPVTLSNVDLIMYKAEGDEESSETLLPVLERTAGRCFAKTKIVYAHLREEVRGKERGRGTERDKER